MNYPMNAFAEIEVGAAEPGSLVWCHSFWALRLAEHPSGERQIMLLSGPDAGSVSGAPHLNGLTVKSPFTWGVFVDELAGNRNNETRPAVSFGPNGPLIHGHVWREPFFPKIVSQSGERMEEVNGAVYTIRPFSIWLVNEAGEQVGDAPLLVVG